MLNDKLSLRLILPTLLVALMVLYSAPVMAFTCGDINHDSDLNILDIVDVINYKYKEGPAPNPLAIADVNSSGAVDILDIVHFINFKYKSGPVLACPLYECAVNPGSCLGELRAPIDNDTYTKRTDCLPDADGYEQMYAEMIDGDLHVYHKNAYYNCCLEYRAEFEVNGNVVTVREYDDAMYCHCDCYFHLEAVLGSLPPIYDRYTVVLYGIDGNEVGFDYVYPEEMGYMLLDLDGNDLHVYHLNAYYNCCLGYRVEYSIMGNGINIWEYDDGEPCDCICFFNLESIIEDIPPGEYFVTLFGIYGDTVGFEQIVVDGPELTGFDQQGCFDNAGGNIKYTYDAGMLTMEHLDAYFNCGAEDMIVIEFVQIGNTLRFTEINTSDEAAYCMCYFELEAIVENIFPGDYIAEIYAIDYPGEDPHLIDQRELHLE